MVALGSMAHGGVFHRGLPVHPGVPDMAARAALRTTWGGERGRRGDVLLERAVGAWPPRVRAEGGMRGRLLVTRPPISLRRGIGTRNWLWNHHYSSSWGICAYREPQSASGGAARHNRCTARALVWMIRVDIGVLETWWRGAVTGWGQATAGAAHPTGGRRYLARAWRALWRSLAAWMTSPCVWRAKDGVRRARFDVSEARSEPEW